MKVVIAGAGDIGAPLIKKLSHENIEIVAIDVLEESLAQLKDIYNIKTINASIVDSDIYRSPLIKKADLFIALTERDERNMIACQLASEAGIKRTVCRIRQIDYSSTKTRFSFKSLGIDWVINPLSVLANELYRMIMAPNMVDSHQFFNNDFILAGFKITPDATVIGQNIENIRKDLHSKTVEVAITQRGDHSIIPTRDFIIEEGDVVFFICKNKNLKSLRAYLGYPQKSKPRIFINGAGQVGSKLARKLEKEKFEVIVLDKNHERCNLLSDKLQRSMVLNVDGTDSKTLFSEGIIEADYFVSVTNEENINIASCLLAHNFDVKHTIALVHQAEMIPIIDKSTPINQGISPRILTARYISRHIHGNNINAYFALHNSQIEVLELTVSNENKLIGYPLSDSRLPENVKIGMLNRKGKYIIPKAEDSIQTDDTLLLILHRYDRTKVIEFFKK